jgi:hypothetical protein
MDLWWICDEANLAVSMMKAHALCNGVSST